MASTIRQAAKAATRAKVLSSAKTLFEQVGYEAATIRAIADWANVSTGAVFANFTGKAELWQAIYGEPPISPEKARVVLEALRELTAACEDDCGVPDEDDEDDEAVGGNATEDMALTFGMLRRARAAIALTTTPTAQTEAA